MMPRLSRSRLASFGSLTLTAAAAIAACAACRGASGDDDGGTVDSPAADDMTIQQVQDPATMVTTAVNLKGVVVTGIDNFGGRKGNFYVEEPEGGAFSGVLVFGAPVDQVAALAVGDLVDLTGAAKDEYSQPDDDATVTELIPASSGSLMVNKTGTGTVPPPHVIDALTVGQMAKADREAEYEKWEGVLVQVNSVSVTSGLRAIGSTDPTFRGFGITGLLQVDSSLADIPNTPANLVNSGDCLATITGMGDYFYDYKVLPRATADIVLGGSNCPLPETGATACGDTIDNDANGFADCQDNGCMTLPACQTNTTVSDVQSNPALVGTVASIANAYVIAMSPGTNRSVWVADSLVGAPNNTVQLFRGNGATTLPASIVVGAKVSVVGQVQEFNNDATGGTLTELSGAAASITFVAAPTGQPTPITGVSIATLTTDATAEPYESTLVEIHNVKIIGVPPTPDHGVRWFGTVAGTTVFESDDDIAPVLGAAGTCYTLIRGIWSYQVFDNKWAILPLAGGGDVTIDGSGAACP